MKNFIKSTFFIALLIFTTSSCGQKEKNSDVQNSTIKMISAQELNKKTDKVTIIDVRTPGEYESGHLPNAMNINYSSSGFKEQLNALNKDQEIYVYCKVGGRSARAAKTLEELGFTKIYDLKGGIKSWQKEGFKIVQ